jgi:hypothetical protein
MTYWLRLGWNARLSAVLTAAILVATSLLASAAPAQAAGFIICAPGVNTFVWDGNADDTPGQVGDNVSWNDAYNWDVDCTPGLLGQPQDDDVTIPSGASVSINDGESAYILALHNEGSLLITDGGVLKTINDSESETLELQGLLFGTGRFTVTGTLDWNSTPAGAATQSTRRCAVAHDDCSAAAPAPGTTVIAESAKMTIDGAGVNLSDQRIIENHGTVVLDGNGYIAADYGTAFKNQRLAGDPAPRLLIKNDRGYYQGFSSLTFGLSDFINTGKVIKANGSGTSIIDADYATTDLASPHAGKLVVKSGVLSVLSPAGSFVNTAKVKQGTAFGNGAPDSCDPENNPSSCALIQPTADDAQASSVALTKPGPTSANVTIQELPLQANPGHGVPVKLETPGADADAANPLLFRIFLDATLVEVGETPNGLAANVPVERKASPASPYQVLPSCSAVGGPAPMQPCVARSMSVNETAALGSGDVVLVVKSLLNSRYRVGK